MLTTRDVSIVAALTALYVVVGSVSSYTLRTVTRSADLFFLISALFAILVVVVGKPWTATLLGTTSGLIFLLFLLTPIPFPPHVAAALVVNGLVFDGYLKVINRDKRTSPSRSQIVLAASLGSLAMAAVVLALFEALGTILPLTIWVIALITDVLIGALGGFFGIIVARRLRPAGVVRT